MSANRWVVTDGIEVHHVSTAADLDAVLDVMHERARSRHSLASITSPSNTQLLIGLGGAQSVLQFTQGSDPPFLATLGVPDAVGVETFFYQGHETEIERRRLIPMESARRAAATFLATGMRPSSVHWEEV